MYIFCNKKNNIKLKIKYRLVEAKIINEEVFMEIKLNEQQETAKNLIKDWWENKRDEKQYFVLAGYAGTGKTFLVNYLIKYVLEIPIEKVTYVAPTGKAASVLVQRGASNATTIHKLIYNRIEKEYENEINGKIIKTKRFEFVKKPSIPNYKLIIVDETSMVEKKIMEDLLSFGIPMICCGDAGQLPRNHVIKWFIRKTRL